MPQENWVVLEQVSGSAVAEMLKGLLEAQGLEVLLSQEGIGGWAYSRCGRSPWRNPSSCEGRSARTGTTGYGQLPCRIVRKC